MAEFRQGYLDDYSQNSTGVGIGTSSPVDAKLEIIGGTTSQELNVTGIATFGSVSGFIEKHTTYTENVNINIGDSGTLSGEIVVGAGLTMTVGTGATTSQGSVDSLKVFNMFQPPSGTTNQRPPGKPGALFYNFDFKTIEFFDGNSWRQVDNTTIRGRAIFAAGNNSDNPDGTSNIEFVQISSQGNGIDFGNLTRAAFQVGGAGSNTRGVFAGGDPGPSGSDVIDYITLASSGDAIDFGNLSAGGRCAGGASSQTRALFGGVNSTNAIEYVQIQTLGNAVDFGDIANGQSGTKGYLTSSPTRFFYFSGNNDVANIEFGTIASLGNTTTFGDSTSIARRKNFASNTTRAIFAGGYTGDSPTQTTYKAMDFITMASEGNAVIFGDLTVARSRINMTGDERTCVMAGGHTNPSTMTPSIDFVNYSSQGNAQHFGDLSITKSQGAATSDSHGGLGGF